MFVNELRRDCEIQIGIFVCLSKTLYVMIVQFIQRLTYPLINFNGI